MKLTVLATTAAILTGLVAIASRPRPAQAFACSTQQTCSGGCRTVVGGTQYEGVHICNPYCTFPACKPTFSARPGVEHLVQSTTKGDVRAAVKLATKYGNSVVYSEERNGLFFYAPCGGELPIGFQPLNESQGFAVAGALASSNRSTERNSLTD